MCVKGILVLQKCEYCENILSYSMCISVILVVRVYNTTYYSFPHSNKNLKMSSEC